jgi:hypothetical protein
MNISFIWCCSLLLCAYLLLLLLLLPLSACACIKLSLTLFTAMLLLYHVGVHSRNLRPVQQPQLQQQAVAMEQAAGSDPAAASLPADQHRLHRLVLTL